MITFEVSGDLEMFRTTARDFAQSELRPQNRIAEDAGAAPESLKAQYLELGLAAIELPEELGGLGQGLVARIVVEEELANGDLALALAMPAPGPYAAAVLALGTEEQKRSLIAGALE